MCCMSCFVLCCRLAAYMTVALCQFLQLMQLKKFMSILDQERTDCRFYLYIFCLSVRRFLVFLLYFIFRICTALHLLFANKGAHYRRRRVIVTNIIIFFSMMTAATGIQVISTLLWLCLPLTVNMLLQVPVCRVQRRSAPLYSRTLWRCRNCIIMMMIIIMRMDTVHICRVDCYAGGSWWV